MTEELDAVNNREHGLECKESHSTKRKLQREGVVLYSTVFKLIIFILLLKLLSTCPCIFIYYLPFL
jgi:predicted nucleic acid-binding Zn ribbon protein